MNILLVDDDQDMGEYLVAQLASYGLQIQYISSGIEALSYIENNHIDLLLLDWNMPGMSGLEVLEEVRKFHSPSELPVIMVTSVNETNNIVTALTKGCNDYTTKPLNLETLAARMNTQLSLKKLHDDNAAKNKLEAITEVITTLNHEINNPLFIALNHVRKANKRADYSQLEKVEAALVRITNIVKQINELTLQSKKIFKETHVEEVA